MVLRIRFQGGARAGESEEFPDEHDLIVIGRDADKCQVVFPPDETLVGREHCALKRVLGRYRLILNRDNLVLLDGEPAVDEQELGEEADLQLGEGGPTLVVQTTHDPTYEPTLRKGAVQPGRATILKETARSARRGKTVGLVALVLVLVLGTAAYFVSSRLGKKQKELEEQQEGLATSIQVAEGKLENDLQALGTAQRALNAAVKELGEEVLGKIEALKPQLQGHLKRASGSVYQVLAIRGKGTGADFTICGTAWVVADGLLATNSHVAAVYAELVPKGYRLIARLAAPDVKDFEIESVEMHPGYLQFIELWREYEPAYRSGAGLRGTGMAGPACDVALLRIKDPKGLGKKLVLASEEEQRNLARGDVVGAVGFPTESMSLVNPRTPISQMTVGCVTAITDFLGVSQDDGPLIHHSVGSAGGSSGSPILNGNGHVVAVLSGGNVVINTPNGRIGSPSGIGFGQRTSLLQNLLQGHAAKIQEARLRRWKEGVRRLFESGAKARVDARITRFEAAWKRECTTWACDWDKKIVDRSRIRKESGTLSGPAGPNSTA